MIAKETAAKMKERYTSELQLHALTARQKICIQSSWLQTRRPSQTSQAEVQFPYVFFCALQILESRLKKIPYHSLFLKTGKKRTHLLSFPGCLRFHGKEQLNLWKNLKIWLLASNSICNHFRSTLCVMLHYVYTPRSLILWQFTVTASQHTSATPKVVSHLGSSQSRAK